MVEVAWGGAAAAGCRAHQSPAVLCGICPGMAPCVSYPFPPKNAIRSRSWGYAGQGLGSGATVAAWGVH